MQIQQLSKLMIPGLFTGLITLAACTPPVPPTSDELITQFPSVGPSSTRDENPKILCPFQRMLERSGLYDAELDSDITVSTTTVADASETFGCNSSTCGAVANQVAVGQGHAGAIDLEMLHDAGAISHECGLTFANGGTEVSEAVRNSTLARLLELADSEGHLVYDDLFTVKQEICAAQGVNRTAAGTLETKLIFAYLGGVENGFITYTDVERFLHAEMPETKTDQWITSGLLNQVQ